MLCVCCVLYMLCAYYMCVVCGMRCVYSMLRAICIVCVVCVMRMLCVVLRVICVLCDV